MLFSSQDDTQCSSQAIWDNKGNDLSAKPVWKLSYGHCFIQLYVLWKGGHLVQELLLFTFMLSIHPEKATPWIFIFVSVRQYQFSNHTYLMSICDGKTCMGLAAVTSVLLSNTSQLCNVNTGSTDMTGDAKQKTFNQIALRETLFTSTF